MTKKELTSTFMVCERTRWSVCVFWWRSDVCNKMLETQVLFTLLYFVGKAAAVQGVPTSSINFPPRLCLLLESFWRCLSQWGTEGHWTNCPPSLITNPITFMTRCWDSKLFFTKTCSAFVKNKCKKKKKIYHIQFSSHQSKCIKFIY